MYGVKIDFFVFKTPNLSSLSKADEIRKRKRKPCPVTLLGSLMLIKQAVLQDPPPACRWLVYCVPS